MHLFAFALNSKGDLGKSFQKTMVSDSLSPYIPLLFHVYARLQKRSLRHSCRPCPGPLTGDYFSGRACLTGHLC